MQSIDEEISVPEMGLALVLRMRGGSEDGGDEDGGDGEVLPAIDVGAARHSPYYNAQPTPCCPVTMRPTPVCSAQFDSAESQKVLFHCMKKNPNLFSPDLSNDDDEVWSGGYFELALELGSPDDSRLIKAESCLWAHPSFEQDGARSFGVATIPDIGTTCCKVITVLEGDRDWLVLCIPMEGLGRVVDVGAYPFQDGSDLSWTTALQDWLVAIAESIFEAVSFELGLTGWDVSGDACAAELRKTGIPTTERWMGYLWPEKGTLSWFPPTVGEAPIRLD